MNISVKIFFRQMLRSKVRLLLNVALIAAATAFFVMSINLYQNSRNNLQAVDGSYTTLSGTIALAEEDKDRINYFRVLVYNEDNECFYESDWISDKQPNPIDVNCNISGMTRITIELEGCSTTCSTVKVIMPDEGFVFKGPKGTVDAND